MDIYEQVAREILLDDGATIRTTRDLLKKRFPEPQKIEGVSALIKGIRSKQIYGDGVYTLNECEAEKLISDFITAREADKWISITERLPNHGDLVDVYRTVKGISIRITDVYFWNTGVPTWEVLSDGDLGDYLLKDVVFWQPRPKSPKELK